MLFLQTIGDVPQIVTPKLKVFAKKLKKSPGTPTLRRLPCVDMHEIMGVENPEEPEEIEKLHEQFMARDDYQEVWGWEFFYIPGIAYEAWARSVFRNSEGRHFDVLGPADYQFDDILFMEDTSCDGTFLEPPKLFPLVRSKDIRETYDTWLGEFATFLFDGFGHPEEWDSEAPPMSPMVDEIELRYAMQRLNVHRHITQIALAHFQPHPKHMCPCGSNKRYEECCQPAMEDFHAFSSFDLFSAAKELRLSRPDDDDYAFLDEVVEDMEEAGYDELIESHDQESSDSPHNEAFSPPPKINLNEKSGAVVKPCEP